MTMGCPSGGKTQSAAERDREREALKTKVERANLGKAERSSVPKPSYMPYMGNSFLRQQPN